MGENVRLKMLTDEELGIIYEKSVEYLSKRGMRVHHAEALKIFDREGAQVDFSEQQVRFPRDIIEEALRTVPHEFLMADRKGDHDCPLPHPNGHFYLGSVTGALHHLAPGSKAYCDITIPIIREWNQLLELLEDVSVIRLNTPRDVPYRISDIHSLKATIENTSKHIHIQPYSLESLEYLFELGAAAAGSADKLKERPVITMMCCALTPFALKAMDMEAIILSSRYGTACTIESLATAGATTPITVAGTVLATSIETLGLLVMSQLVKPGTKVIGGPLPFALDMATGASRVGKVEGQMVAAGITQFVKEVLKIPVRLNVGTDAFIPDGHSMIETTIRSILVSEAGCDLLADAGSVDFYKAASPIQIIIENDLAKILKRIQLGITVNDETLAWADVLDTGPGGHFVERDHTLRHCRDTVQPALFQTPPMDRWMAEGSKDLHSRAVDRFHELRGRFEPQPLPEDMKKELDRIVKKADQHLAG
jgi:trimethylamine:corrinoid methyltransferase-like protein